ncbi:MAG: anthranilate/aminodeoxychorismate synthase component II [Chloroflexi bacterium]|nr:anthranilate/aminodeoxychorismate synthase component II [Chloroflexota bacterium]|tara:strand:- start:246 stop:815 length:570 start_codon:yes stop_codon:yes gene_type:complete
MLLLIDNYDSFTYNLYQYLSELGVEVEVFRNDKISVEDCLAMQPEQIVISPGPCTPSEAGISIPLVRSVENIPLLGVCLGHQAIGSAFGAEVVQAGEIMHGKTSLIHHDSKGVFSGLPQDFQAIRYHSLVLEKTSIPDDVSVTATTPSGLIMGIRHKKLPIEGVQFHPESIMTENGHQLLKNFLNIRLN